jgi:hypothetical protein
LKVFENRLLTRIIETKRDEEAGVAENCTMSS